MCLVLKKPGPILEECHRTFPDSQKENGRVSAQETSIERARPESQARLSRARHHCGPGLTSPGRPPPRGMPWPRERSSGPASAAVAPQPLQWPPRALQWPASTAVVLARLQ
jgi:hypothetical protein